MTEFFELLFSPSGCVGRAVWWIGSFLIALAEVFLIFLAFLALGLAFHDLGPLSQVGPEHGKLTPEQSARLWAAFNSAEGELCAIGVLMLLGIWSGMAIEIKRWHDRGMSGFLVLLRFIPVGFWIYTMEYPKNHDAMMACMIVSAAIGLFQIIQLGFLSGIDLAPAPSKPQRNYGPSQTRGPTGPARPAQPASSGSGTFVLGFLCAIFLVGAVGAAYYFEGGSLPGLPPAQANSTNSVASASQPETNAPAPANAPAPVAPSAPATPPVVSAAPANPTAAVTPPVPPPGGLNDNILTREHSEHDSMTTTYAKDWVIANGERLTGITRVTAAPGMQVTLVYSNGGKNIDAASLPQGFLDQWGITPAALAAANQPVTNQP